MAVKATYLNKTYITSRQKQDGGNVVQLFEEVQKKRGS